MTDKTAADAVKAPSLPLFYQQPRPLDRVRHAAARLREPADLAFAAPANNLPILIEEFAHAGHAYPIVFTLGDVPTPVALLGLLLVWPVLHIVWVTGTAELFGASFGQHVRLSPFMSQAAVAAWLVYLAILAPVAEELLLRGEAFARASAAVGPVGAILVTG